MAILSITDIENLTRDPSITARVTTATRLSTDYAAGTFTPAEAELAVQIFRIMLKDAAVRVRQALSENLNSNSTIPRDVARALAADVDLVALPILEHSPVMTADDLVEIIVAQRNIAKMSAIGRRESIPAVVTSALVANGDVAVAAIIAANPGAEFTESALDLMLDRHGADPAVNRPLAGRAVLPVRIAERLTALVADEFRAQLMTRHKLNIDTAMELVLTTRERATVNLAKGYSESEVASLTGRLLATNRLTASLVLRAVCMGHRVFFEHALARLSGIALANILIMLREPQSFEKAWARALLPAAMFPAAIAALHAITEIEAEGRDLTAGDFSRRIVERVMTQYETFGVEFAHDDLEYMFAKVAAKDAPRAAA